MKNPVNALKQTSARYKTLDAKDRKKFWIDGLLNNAIYIILVVFLIYTYMKNKNIASVSSAVNLLTLVAANLPMALGIGGCIVLTGTDLSAGRVVGLTGAISASLLQAATYINKFYADMGEMPIILVILLAMAIGGIVGLVNGFFVAKFELHPFIVTLATQLIVYGTCLLYYMLNGNNGQPISGLSDKYTNFVKGTILPKFGGQSIPNYVIYALIVLAIMWFIWNKTPFGKNMFAVGSNPEAAKVSGVNVFMTTVMVHTLAGITYGYTGFIDAARIASNTPNSGQNYESDAIAACVIGGVSFVGGTGTIGGVVLGVVLLRIIFVCLNYLAIDQNLQYIIKGAIILLACSIDMRKYLTKK
ncbi:MAG: beta-methylgalactoside transporter [Lachnospiraceae bacterium]|nr:beta-methylgalactoside transporter [Lachnospiraceae bacterium]